MITALILCSILIIWLIYSLLQKPRGYPPGPPFLPIIGSAYTVPARTAYKSIEIWKNTYGNIVGHKLGNKLVVFIRGYEDVKNGLKHPNFQGRSDSPLFTQRTFYKQLGFFFNVDENVFELRRVFLKYLGLNCISRMDIIVTEEMQRFIKSVKTDTPIEINNAFITVPFDVLMKNMTGIEGISNIEKFLEFRRSITAGFRAGRTTGLEIYYPFLRYFINYKSITKYTSAIQEYIRECIEQRRATLNSGQARDLVDIFLIEQEKLPEIFTDEQIISCFVELIEAGNESISNTIGFVFLYMALYPHVQEKMHEELDKVIGPHKTPCLDDRHELPYMEAVISETMRINPISPLTVNRVVTEDTKFCGYGMPEGTYINYSLWSIFHDDALWDKPNDFIPERFIKDGKFEKPEYFLPFSTGKRNCVGEFFAKNMLFLHVVMFFQKYMIHLMPGEELPTTEALTGFTNAPKPFTAIIKRKQPIA